MASLVDAARNRIRWLGHRLTATAFYNETLPRSRDKAGSCARLMRADRPIGTYLLLWPVLWALWFASGGRPQPTLLVVFTIGVFLTRSAGCVINDYADRNFDAHVKRTRNRPLVNGELTARDALILFSVLLVLAATLLFFLNNLARLLALIGAVMIVTYPFFKRFFPLPQFYLGAAFTWSVPMVYAAETGGVPRVAWLVFFAGLLWTMAYDTMYAMVDRDDDLKIGLRSSAIYFGDADRAIIAAMQALVLLALALVGREMNLGGWFAAGLAGAALCALYEQWLIRDRDRDRCFQAFLHNNYVGMLIFIGIALDYLYQR
jgi:4-hydroxybenzoate polyprenyltransferase